MGGDFIDNFQASASASGKGDLVTLFFKILGETGVVTSGTFDKQNV
jgi:hypothetical protein